MSHNDYATFDDLAFWLIWVPALVLFVPIFVISACVVLPIAWVIEQAWRAFDALYDQYRGSRS